MIFGKNRVQYNNFFWQHYDFGNYKAYYHIGGDRTARYVGLRARSIITEMEYRLDYKIDRDLNFIVYSDLLDFRQSNIGLVSGNDDYNIGGVTTIANNKVLIYFNGHHYDVDRQIRKNITELLINSILVGDRFTDRIANLALKTYPQWFMSGIIAYFSHDYDADMQQKIKDGILYGNYTKLQWLNGLDAELAGCSFWTYVAINYGEESLKDILYLSRVTRNVTNAFVFVTGSPFKNLVREWAAYTQYRLGVENESTSKSVQTTSMVKTKEKLLYQNLQISRDGNYAAWSTNEQGKVKIVIKDLQSGKQKTVFKFGHRLPQLIDQQYPILRWHPQIQVLSWIYENEQIIKLCFYDFAQDEVDSRNVLYVNRILDYDFKSDGAEIAFSGVKNGQTDLFLLNLASNDQHQLTNDLPDNINPRFTSLDQLVFSSNRANLSTDTLKSDFDIYVTSTDEYQPVAIVSDPGNQTDIIPLRADSYLYLSDQYGTNNRFYSQYDSAIKFIDTAIHYRFYTNSYPLTNVKQGISHHTLFPNKDSLADIQYYQGRNIFHVSPLNLDNKGISLKLIEQRAFFDIRRDFYARQLAHLQQNISDSLIDINNYVFDFEKRKKRKLKNWPKLAHDSLWVLKRRLYVTTFYTNYLVNQVDFSQLNLSYQVYTGGAVFFNPGFNVLTKFGAADLFEDYKITAGIRLSANFSGNEYLVSVENVKNRWDKQLILHRMGAEEFTADEEYIRSYSYQTILVFKYPFNQVSSTRFTEKIRVDQIVYPAIDNATLVKPDEYRLWASTLGEYVFDNTTSLGLNLFRGTRAKVFGEYYNQLGKNQNKHMFVIGADIRHYIKIHRQLIWVNRFATSSSFGNALLIYYLGGVDNWMSFSGRKYFDQTIPVDQSKAWAFQTVATNMRGFQQNIRNGNSFAVLNSEIRWPIIKYLFNKPINNDLLDNFMIAGFLDIGSAWYGWDITNKNNFYRYDYVEKGPVSVRIDKHRDPIVGGYGFGLRTRFFGYYFRLDWAWGVENMQVLDRVFYFSINLDF